MSDDSSSPVVTDQAQASDGVRQQDAEAGTLKPPPASFLLLVSTIGTQAMAAMGQLDDSEGSPTAIRLEFAKSYIDMLGILEEKTKGNLTSQESQVLSGWLYRLRMIYVSVSSRK